MTRDDVSICLADPCHGVSESILHCVVISLYEGVSATLEFVEGRGHLLRVTSVKMSIPVNEDDVYLCTCVKD